MSYENTTGQVKDGTPDEAKKRRAEAIVKKMGALASEQERTNTENTIQECFKYIIPSKGDVTSTVAPGGKFGQELFDETAIHANELLSAALHGNLTNPAARFIDFFLGDPILDDDDEVKKWCQIVGDRMFLVLNASNFQTEIHEVYLDIGATGNAYLFMGDHPDTLVHFSARAFKECYVDENNLGKIDTLYRKFKWKKRQIVQEFGEQALTDDMLRQYRDGNEEQHTIIHAVEPLVDAYMSDEAKAQKWKWASCYTMESDKHLLSEKGFRTFPYATPRWSKKSGEKYGRGCGHSMMPTIKMVNVQEETQLQGAQLAAAPPFGVTDDSVMGKVKLTPFGLTVVRRSANGEFPIQQLMTGTNINFGEKKLDSARERIMRGFYANQFTLPAGGANRTAEEVATITQQNFKLMGPVLGRLHFELLDPIVQCLYDKMERDGLIPEMPEKMKAFLRKGKKIQARFSSLIARAQRQAEADSLIHGITAAAPIVNAKPETLDILNTDEAFKYILFDLYGAPFRLKNDERAIQQIREARQKAQEQLAKERAQAHQADIVSKVGPSAAQFAQVEAR